MDLKDSVNLPQTEFSMKANLSTSEPKRLEKWQTENTYQKIRAAMKGKKIFVCADGPPYANGKIHLGHAVNKVLKDIICKSKTLEGFDAPFVPGWDCHGLPIEHKVEQMVGKVGDKISAKEFRNKCREYAASQVAEQKADFMRLGVLAEWDNPYLTMAPAYEAQSIRAIGKILENGHLKQGFKPVYWCFDCASALAEAELEYQPKKSSALDVKFALKGTIADLPTQKPVYAVIWTTTPWTLPANEAVAFGAKIQYAFVDVGSEILIIAESLIESVLARGGLSGKIIHTEVGAALEGLQFAHPIYENKWVPGVLGDHVTTEAGTGLVHTAPAHGPEDYTVGQKYNLPSTSPLLGSGVFAADTPVVGGIFIRKADSVVIEHLRAHNTLLATATLEHSYPMCWRHKTPVAYRATAQWFIGMQEGGFLTKVQKSVDNVQWVPEWGYARMKGMLEDRPDWCVSRQRTWGVPLPLILHKQTGALHPDMLAIIYKVADAAEEKGIDAWFDASIESLISDHEHYEKSTNTIDVWFDSGVYHACVLDKRPGLHAPADVVIEGSDQHRGWFQSLLLTSMAIKGQAPYKAVLTHGFLTDEKGFKMSKSLGNIIEPAKVTQTLGADVLRLWAAAADYRNDMAASDEILKRASESYRRFRNTARFMLSNLYDFTPHDALDVSELVAVDKWAIEYTAQLQKEIIAGYNEYQFHTIYQKIQNFCVNEMGGFYLDVLKDRLYTIKADAKARRSAQTALWHIIQAFTKWIAPILSFTAEEIYEHIPGAQGHVLLNGWHTLPAVNAMDFSTIMRIRDHVNKALEAARNAQVIGGSLEAEVDLYVNAQDKADLQKMGSELRFAFLTSEIQLHDMDSKSEEPIKIAIKKSTHAKCVRCWHRRGDVGHTQAEVCDRCVTNLQSGETRAFL